MDIAKLSEVTELKQEILCDTSEGITYEVCAGLVDKTQSLEEIAQSEVRMTYINLNTSLAYPSYACV